MILTLVFIGFLIPTIGLSIDVGVLYSIRARLSMSVDAAALAGARALGGANPTDTDATNTAKNYVKLNFPTGFFSSSNLTPAATVDNTVPGQRTVSVNASVTAPLYFLRWVGSTSTTVSAMAQVVRRDANVMMVVDRSYSLYQENACSPLKSSATNFVNNFSPGHDAVGLVTFASGSRVDNKMSTSYSGITTTINALQCSGLTNTSHGMWRGYQELVRWNHANALTNALNIMVLFTDGMPTAFTSNLPINSTCKVPSGTAAVLASAGDGPGTSTIGVVGLFDPNAPAQPMPNGDFLPYVPPSPATNSGCKYASNWTAANWYNGSWTQVTSDVPYFPSVDAQGASTHTGYAVGLGGYSNATASGSGWALNVNTVYDAAMDAADDTITRIHAGTVDPTQGYGLSNIIVFGIGLNVVNGSTNSISSQGIAFLKKAANDPVAPNSFRSQYPAGLFIEADDVTDLNAAFARVAAEILRISK